MAKITLKAGDEYAIKLSKMAQNSDEIAKKAIYSAADIVANKIKSNLEGVLSGESSGDLVKAFGVTPISQDKKGDYNTKLGFDGYDRKGVPNALKARVLESGSSKQKKRPFVRPAVNATRKQAQAKMEEVIDNEYEKIFK